MDIRARLTEWGEWQRNLNGVGRHSIISSYGVKTSPATSDGGDNARASDMDIYIAQMKLRNKKFYRVISAIYIWEHTIKTIAEDLNTSEASVKNIRSAAEAFLEGMIEVAECRDKDIYNNRLIG